MAQFANLHSLLPLKYPDQHKENRGVPQVSEPVSAQVKSALSLPDVCRLGGSVFIILGELWATFYYNSVFKDDLELLGHNYFNCFLAASLPTFSLRAALGLNPL